MPNESDHNITWTMRPFVTTESLRADDFLASTPTELLAYAADCRDECRSLRVLLHLALAQVSAGQHQNARAAAIIADLQRVVRDYVFAA